MTWRSRDLEASCNQHETCHVKRTIHLQSIACQISLTLTRRTVKVKVNLGLQLWRSAVTTVAVHLTSDLCWWVHLSAGHRPTHRPNSATFFHYRLRFVQTRLQGSVATRVRHVGIFIDTFITECVGEHLATLSFCDQQLMYDENNNIANKRWKWYSAVTVEYRGTFGR